MKIAFVFSHAHKSAWSTPGGLAEAIRIANHEVDFYDLQKPEEVLEVSHHHSKYDAVCLWEAGTISKEVEKIWHKDNFKSTLMLAESGDDPQIFRYNLQHTLPADVVITPDNDACEQYKRIGKNAYWLTHWGDESVWKFCAHKDTGRISTSAGPRPGMWNDLMQLLLSKFPDVFYNPRIQGGQYVSVEENVKLYDNSDVVVQVSSNKEITRRLFEASICGRVVVTDRLSASKKLKECLVEDEHILLYDTPEECVDKVQELLKDSERRKKISDSAYRHVLENHSSSARAKQLIEIIKQNI